MNKEFDNIIIGSGPAGVSTWLYLNKLAPNIAKKTLIIEKQNHPREKLCGGALLNPFVNKMIHDVSINDNICNNRLDLNYLDVRKGSHGFKFKESGFLSIIHRPEFDCGLLNLAKKRGAKVHEDETFISLKEEKYGVIIETNKDCYQVKHVIGADGASSNVRKSVGLDQNLRFALTREVFTSVSENDYEYSKRFASLDWGCIEEGIQGYMWHFPCIIDGRPSMNHGILDCKITSKTSNRDISLVFEQELKSRDLTIPSSQWKGHPISYRIGDYCLSTPRVLLVGDAAGIEPLIGGGIHLGMLYGSVAAQTIKDSGDGSLELYTDNIRKSVVGKFIDVGVQMAYKVYSGEMDVLQTIRKNLEMCAMFGNR